MEERKAIMIYELSGSSKRRFLLMITLSIVVSFVLVLVSMSMYSSSGAAQLDLSRPGYQSVRAQAAVDDSDFQNYTVTGPINQLTISEFKTLYAGQAVKTKSVDAFGGDPLSPDALGLNLVTN